MQKDIEATDESAQAEFFEQMRLAGESLRAFRPDIAVVFYPDHFLGFFLDLMPSFCVALAGRSAAEFGIPAEDLRIPKELGIELVRHLQDEQFDVAFSHKLTIDHGMTLPFIQLTGGLAECDVIPVFINCAGDPRPSFRRVRLFGEAVGRFFAGRLIEDREMRVAVVGSGGLSHDSPTSRIARETPERFLRQNERTPEQQEAFEDMGVANARAIMSGNSSMTRPPNRAWDDQFLATFLNEDGEALDVITDEELDTVAGGGTHEVRTWVAAAAAAGQLGATNTKLAYYRVIPEWITGMGIVVDHG
jgi:2,3-dihydroxyphenylpropionate 1,2-dioxygenase